MSRTVLIGCTMLSKNSKNSGFRDRSWSQCASLMVLSNVIYLFDLCYINDDLQTVQILQ